MSDAMRVEFSEDWGKIDAVFWEVPQTVEGDDLFDVLSGGAYVVLGKAQENAPVDTGFMRASGEVQRDGDVPVIGFAAEYSVHVEYGTSKMPAQPYLRPALGETDEIVAAMAKIHQSKLDGA